ncbi:hypothetical protein ILUMI_21144 [Ignelater luminosus]|uniref:Uncharacterized protein n=1 Tax=Ignelater luminosus TaxID=2038154 RepID=A0A8K0G465_IGNLU|nr:hypothetical protein ILUMI_21144 [Ignelater luminosus]
MKKVIHMLLEEMYLPHKSAMTSEVKDFKTSIFSMLNRNKKNFKLTLGLSPKVPGTMPESDPPTKSIRPVLAVGEGSLVSRFKVTVTATPSAISERRRQERNFHRSPRIWKKKRKRTSTVKLSATDEQFLRKEKYREMGVDKTKNEIDFIIANKKDTIQGVMRENKRTYEGKNKYERETQLRNINKEISMAMPTNVSKYNTKEIKRAIEENKGMKVLRKTMSEGQKNINRLNTVERLYAELYTEKT